eukprot:3843094-Prymnesium_polylepis.1
MVRHLPEGIRIHSASSDPDGHRTRRPAARGCDPATSTHGPPLPPGPGSSVPSDYTDIRIVK